MSKRAFCGLILAGLLACATTSFATQKTAPPQVLRPVYHDRYYRRWERHPFYIGGAIGYGTTDWSMIEEKCGDDYGCNVSIVESAPTSAGDVGVVWGATIGYEIQPLFAVETNFYRYPKTIIQFYPLANQYQLLYDDATVESSTYVYDIVAKVMVEIAHTGVRGYANAGGAVTHRNDILATTYRITPTFGIGIDYVFPYRMMVALGFQYFAGYDKATLKPASDYIPFLYSVNLTLAYRI